MTEIASQYLIGDWVVHYAYGIGQIKKIEKKPIRGEPEACFQVTTQNGANWWFPKYGAENPRVRPVATKEMLLVALDEFEKITLDLDPDKNLWKIRMDEVMKSGGLIETVQIMRDLTVLQAQRKFNQMETKAFGLFKERLLREWSAILNTNIEVIEPELKRYLQVCKERAIAESPSKVETG